MSVITRALYVVLLGLCLLLPPITATHAAPPGCDAATEGTIVYNKSHKLVQFCNGTQWIGLTAKIGGAGDTLSDLNCQDGEIVKWNGSNWTCAEDSGGLAALQGTDDPGACTLAKDGLIKYKASNDPAWQYCDGGTTSWLPFRLPQCQDDDAGVCTLALSRIANDPQFKPSSIRCGDKLLGVTGTHGSGSSSTFTFTDATNAALSTLTTASAVTISGIPAGCPGEVFVSGQGSPQISINGGTWGTTGAISNGQTLAVRLTSSASFSTTHTATVSIGSTEEEWSVTTLAADTTPNAFSFTDQTSVALSTLTTSNIITISGINTTTAVSVTGTGAQISINGGAWVTSGNITNGQTLAVRLTSSASFNTAMAATVNVGGVTDSWSVTTRSGNDCTIASGTTWAVAGKTCTSPSVLTVSHSATGSRTDSTEPTTGSATWSCNDGTPTLQGGSTCVESCSANQAVSWSTNCTAQSGALLANGANRSITNTASGYSGTRTITCNNGTLDQSGGSCTGTDSTPNAYSFTDVTGQALSTLITSNTITIAGLTTGASVSVSGSGSPKISINGGAWVTSGTITSGQTLRVQLTSSGSFSTALSATVDVGGVTDSWSVTTLAADTTPNAFDFTPNLTDQALSTLVYSNTITIGGINASTPVSVSGTGSPQVSINGGGWVTSGMITNGQSLRVRLTTANAYATARSATVNVGGVTDGWSATTLANVTPGSQSYTTAGSFTFTVPAYNNLTVQVWGGGGGGGAGVSSSCKAGGSDGGASNFNGTVIANGGKRAGSSSAGAGGTASGGTTNQTGGAGGTSSSNKGGNGASGGAGGAAPTSSNSHGKNGSAPGGGGSGAWSRHPMGGNCRAPGGGGGGYSTRTYTAGQLAVGAGVPVVVGIGGTKGNDTYDGGNGAVGRVTINWN